MRDTLSASAEMSPHGYRFHRYRRRRYWPCHCPRTGPRSGREVIVLERHGHIGQETSSRNSEVIHAGIYYPKNSLKAELCVRGKHLLYDFCESHHIEHKRLGKLIVATTDEQCEGLSAIFQKALDNGVEDVRYIEQSELRELEPQLNAQRAIHSPSTGIINSHELMLGCQGDLENMAAWLY